MNKLIDKKKITCGRCGNLCSINEITPILYLCKDCFADVKEILGSMMGDGDCTDRGTLMCKIKYEGEVLFWAMYNPNREDEIMEIARHLQRNLVPVRGWEIQTAQGASYLLVIGIASHETVSLIMKHIDPQVPTTNLKQIVWEETERQRAMGRMLSESILGKSCGNKLEVTIHEVGEVTDYANDLTKAGLSPVDAIEKVLTKFYVADPITRKFALIGWLCSSSQNIIDNVKTKGLIPLE